MTRHETGSLFSTMTQNSAVDTLVIGTHHSFGKNIMGAQVAAEGGGGGGTPLAGRPTTSVGYK